MILTQVTISGTVGKQVVATTKQGTLKGLIMSPSAANMSVKIRDGLSGLVLFARALSAQGAKEFRFPKDGHKFTKGLHVTVLGGASDVYLYLN